MMSMTMSKTMTKQTEEKTKIHQMAIHQIATLMETMDSFAIMRIRITMRIYKSFTKMTHAIMTIVIHRMMMKILQATMTVIF